MHELEYVFENVKEHGHGVSLFVLVSAVESGLGKFYIPVAELRPYEIVKFSVRKTQFIFIESRGNVFYRAVETRKYPLVRNGEPERTHLFYLYAFRVHKHETRSVPQLVHKVSRALRLFVDITRVAAGRNALRKRESEAVCAVLPYNVERIDAVTERLTHFSAVLVADYAVYQHFGERDIAHMFET